MNLRVYLPVLGLLVLGETALAQRQPDSPVFKTNKPPEHIPGLEPSNLVWEISQAFLIARKAAAGDPVAQNELGTRYLLGKGVEPDTAKAAYWIALAAEHNIFSARFNLAILQYHGWGTPWNPFESFRSFHAAAEQGMPEAELALTQFYTEHLVVPRNDSLALFWVEKAALAGYGPAKEALPEYRKLVATPASRSTETTTDPTLRSILAEPDTSSGRSDRLVLTAALRDAPRGVRRALGLARYLEWEGVPDSAALTLIHRAADVGSPEALTLLARLAERGGEGIRDTVEALALYVRAIRVGSTKAVDHVTRLLQDAEVVTVLRSRASRGDMRAKYAWATLAGLGFEGDLFRSQVYLTPVQSAEMLASAVSAEYVPALLELGLRYYSGSGVAANPSRAMALWRQAARAGSREASVRIAMTVVRDSLYEGAGREAITELQLAADEGSILAEMALGFWFQSALPPTRNIGLAARHYRAAAVRGSRDALRGLRSLHDALRPPGTEFRMPD